MKETLRFQIGVVDSDEEEDLDSSTSSPTAASGPSSSKPASTASFSWQGEVLRQTRTLQQVASISYEEFLAKIKELNGLSSRFLVSLTIYVNKINDASAVRNTSY